MGLGRPARERAARYLPAMGTTLGGYVPQVLALLFGGLLASLGATWAARTPRARAALARTGATTAGLVALVVLAIGAAGAWLMIRSLLAEVGGALTPEAGPSGGAAGAVGPAIGVAQAFLFGMLVGLPLSLPGVFIVWSDARSEERARSRRRHGVPTRDDRRAYANDLARQIREVSPQPREVRASIGGDGGKVLVLSGDINAEEGERLTAALRRDLADLGFKRVEGDGDWWARV